MYDRHIVQWHMSLVVFFLNYKCITYKYENYKQKTHSNNKQYFTHLTEFSRGTYVTIRVDE